MADLLQRSLDLSTEESQSELFGSLVRMLVPDEARILAALSDGSTYPVVHVAPRPSIGSVGEPVLENASSVGKAAGITLPAYVPAYISRLRMLGLVDIGPEEPALVTEYDILLTDHSVRWAIEQASRQARLSPRIMRRSIRQSALAHELWETCRASRPELKE